MPASVPNSEPEVFTAGETVAWSRLFPGYDSATYTLKYALQAYGKSLINITASAGEDSGFQVSLDAATTAAYAPGCYVWTAFMESNGGTVRTIVARGTVSIQQSPLAAFGPTHSSRMLALIEAALEGRIPNGLESTDIDGQRIDRIPVEALVRIRDKYAAKVKLEQTAAAASLGKRPRNSIGIRFTRPS